MKVKLSKWAQENGYTYKGAYDRFVNHGIPGAFVTETGRIYVDISSSIYKEEKYATYARVSSHKQNYDLQRQSKRISDFCAAKGIIVHKEVKEIASGLNDNRPLLNDLLQNSSITTIIVENKDRLTRFGFNYLSKFSGKKIIVMNEVTEDKDDLMQDLISVITSMVARYYGKRRAGKVKQEIVEIIK